MRAARQSPGMLGVALSLALTRLLASQLYGVTPTDLGTFVSITVLFGASALLAGGNVCPTDKGALEPVTGRTP